VDYRIYLPTPMTDFQDRGGRTTTAISVADLTELPAEYDLVIIGTGAAGLGQLFARDKRSSPFSEPQRHLCVGLFKGIAEQETRAVTFGISPGAGEMIAIDVAVAAGGRVALLDPSDLGDPSRRGRLNGGEATPLVRVAGNTAESNTEGYRWKSSAFVIMLCCNEIRRSQ
jgi:styrene monooxygenase